MSRMMMIAAALLTLACEEPNSSVDASLGPRDGGAFDASASDAAGDASTTGDASAVDAGSLDAGPPIDPIEGVGAATLVRGGFMFTEGPRWLEPSGELIFSDIPADTIFVLRSGGEIETFRAPSGMSNGLSVDVGGMIVAAEHGGRRVARGSYDAAPTTLVDRFEGDRFNSPNDLAVRSDGTIYFTDPPYGLGGRPRELDFVGVFRWTPAGTLVAEDRGALDRRPNGIVLSPDESLLYVADSAHDYVRVFDVAADGALSGARMFLPSVPSPDGMALDSAGNLYVAARDGVRVYAPDGTLWGTLRVGEQPANCAFGGADARSLFVTARAGLYRIDGLRVAGRY